MLTKRTIRIDFSFRNGFLEIEIGDCAAEDKNGTQISSLDLSTRPALVVTMASLRCTHDTAVGLQHEVAEVVLGVLPVQRGLCTFHGRARAR